MIEGIMGGLVASAVFLFFLHRLRPAINISPVISKRTSDDQIIYQIKIVNTGSRNAVRLEAELESIKLRVVPNGHTQTSKPIQLKKSGVHFLSTYKHSEIEDKGSFRFSTEENLDAIFDEDSNNYLRFRLFAIDEMSNFGKLFTVEYKVKRNSIIEGDFEHGDSVNVT